MKILVLGGYGDTGRLICNYLLHETNASIIISGRNEQKAGLLKNELSQKYEASRIETLELDACFHQDLRIGFRKCDMVIVASSTSHCAKRIADEALAAGIHYLDIYYKQDVYDRIILLDEQVRKKKLCFITQAGFHPGLPAAYIRNGARFFDELETANIYFTMNFKVNDPSSVYEIVDSVADMDTRLFKNGQWIKGKNRDFKTIDFGADFGRKTCVPMFLHELEPIPEMFGLKETGVFTTGFNWFTDWLVFPLLTLSQKIKRGLLRRFWAKMLLFGVNRFFHGKEGVVFMLKAKGVKDGKSTQLTLRSQTDSAYLFTVYPVISYLKHFMKGESRKPGVHMMGHLVNTEQLFNDLNRFGVNTKVEVDEV